MARGDHDNDMDVQICEPMKIDDNNDTTMDAVEDYSRQPGQSSNYAHVFTAVAVYHCFMNDKLFRS